MLLLPKFGSLPWLSFKLCWFDDLPVVLSYDLLIVTSELNCDLLIVTSELLTF